MSLEENLLWTLRRRMEKVEPDEVSWQVLHRCVENVIRILLSNSLSHCLNQTTAGPALTLWYLSTCKRYHWDMKSLFWYHGGNPFSLAHKTQLKTHPVFFLNISKNNSKYLLPNYLLTY